MPRRVKKVEYLGEYKLKVRFDNGKIKIVDLASELKKAKNLFLDLVDIDYFKQVECDGFSIIWPNGIDYCPDWLYKHGVESISKRKRKNSSRIFSTKKRKTKASRKLR